MMISQGRLVGLRRSPDFQGTLDCLYTT